MSDESNGMDDVNEMDDVNGMDEPDGLDESNGPDAEPNPVDAEGATADPVEKEGTFLVTHAEDDSAVVRDVADGQVHALAANPGVEVGQAMEATLASEPPLHATWTAVEVYERRTIDRERSEEPPTRQEREAAEDGAVGDLARIERAGSGELHVLSVPEDRTEDAVEDVLEDEATLTRAARLGVSRVEVRAADGVVSVRYLP